MKMRFPIQGLMDEEACYERLREILHPNGLSCANGHELPEGQAPHNRDRAPVNRFRCRQCGGVFDIFTGTVWSGTHYNCVTILLVMRGFVQGTPTKQLAEELNLDYGTLLDRRHRVQESALLATAAPFFSI
ncbi:MAG: hypothetical protein AAF702_43995 [Chloroflexota bacterium]